MNIYFYIFDKISDNSKTNPRLMFPSNDIFYGNN